MRILLVKLDNAFELVEWFQQASGNNLWKDRVYPTWILLVKLGSAFESVIPRGLCLSNSAVHLNLWNGSKKHLVRTCGRIEYRV